MPFPFAPPRAAAVGVLLALPWGAVAAADPAAAIATIKAVSREGGGNPAAAAAWADLTASGAAGLLPTLAAFDDASPAAANWLRTAVDAVAEAEAKAGRKLPAAALEAFLKDSARNPAARRIAFELLAAQDKEAADKLIPGMTDDPSVEIRRDAVAARLAAVKSVTDPAKRLAEYRTLFTAARDKDQVETLAELLEKAGEKPDVTRHFGFVTEWQVVGPFDSTDGKGFAKPYPPEAVVDLAQKYDGKSSPVGWKPAQSSATYGAVNLNKELGKTMDCAGYAYAVLVADKETPAEVRLTGKNALQVFVNGAKVYEKEEYHHGTRLDQHTAKITLKPGRNAVLVKVCQNNQTQSWAQEWDFALRVCDATGGALPLKQVVTRGGQEETITPGALKPAAKEDAK